jgi:glycine/D-amino acid oxidase-like deaminating enzyme
MSLATTALWLDTAPAPPDRPPLDADLSVDVAIVGGGVTGLSTALLCAAAGATVALLEHDRVATGVTAFTTAKVSVLHALVYAELERMHGADATRAYAAANLAGLRRIVDWAAQHDIDCALRRRASYTYVEDPSMRGQLADEVRAARAAGVEAELVDEVPLPYPVAGAVRVGDQAEFDSRAYALGIAAAAERAGARIFEGTHVRSLRERHGPELRTAAGPRVRAGHVVVATHVPIFDRGLYFARLNAKRSYAIAVRGDAAQADGMFISADEPTRSIRAYGDDVLIVGGEGHTAGADRDTRRRYDALEAFARERFGATEVTHRWSSQDLVTPDGLPYIGRLQPLSERVLTATGYRKWGFTNGTAAAEVLAAQIAGRDEPYGRYVDPARVPPVRAAKGLVEENLEVAGHLVGDWLRSPRAPTCTHMGCKLIFNTAERSWDCPCHGSRFASADGRVLEGPATKPLDPRDARAPEEP